MKKSELTQLTQIIEHLVAKEVRKQLPTIIAETFRNMMGKQVVTEENPSRQEIREEIENATIKDSGEMKASLKEIFAGPSMKEQLASLDNPRSVARPTKQFCKDPKLNAILNETVPDLRQREMSVGLAAFQGGYSPAVAMAASAMGASMTGPGEMIPEAEAPAFARSMPTMPGTLPSGASPLSRPPQVLREGQEGGSAPMAELPQNVSALDVARQVPLAAPVAQALTKNYSQMMKLIDKKRKR